MRESFIEKKVCDHAKRNGFLAYKFTSPSRRGVPDRLFIGGGRVFFIEFKAPKGRLTKLQELTIQNMKKAGAEVYVIDNIEEGCALFT